MHSSFSLYKQKLFIVHNLMNDKSAFLYTNSTRMKSKFSAIFKLVGQRVILEIVRYMI